MPRSSALVMGSLVVAFVLSGASGLIYESIWSRYIGLFVGHSAYAQVAVLVIFLGGMSIGAWFTARRTERLREPLMAYALIEALAGVIGLVFHNVYVAATGATYDHVFPHLAGTPWLAISRWAIAGALILPQSLLLGATFPLMTAGAIRRAPDQAGRLLALFYFANSLGAAGGVLLSGFYLVRVAGLPGTVNAAAMLNLIVALGVIVVVRQARGTPAVTGAPATASAAGSNAAEPSGTLAGPARSLAVLLLAASFGTAVASFIYEVAWIRMLSLVLGSATHSFELMLSAFILGLALGAWWVRRRIDAWTRPMLALGLAQCAMGALAIATLPLYRASFQWTSGLLSTFARTESGHTGYMVVSYALCLAVMLPATFCAGMTLPLMTRVLIRAGAGERAIGAVYASNTLGSIVGVALAGLVLMPALGLKGLLVVGGALDAALGVALLMRAYEGPARLTRPVLAAGLASAAVIAGVAFATPLDPLALTSGVYRFGQLGTNGSSISFYRDGRTATVSMRRWDKTGALTLATNGKPDASLSAAWIAPPSTGPLRPLGGDESTQLMLGLVSIAHAPQAKRAAIIGFGSGVTSHTMLGSPALERLVTIEIEPEMTRAARGFYPANQRAFDDPRSEIVIDDAKSYFAASRQPFDLIVSEPSNPWVSGVSGLFTDEFYARVNRSLAPNGVFGQWLHLYEIDDDLVLGVLAALHRHFAWYEIYLVAGRDILVVAGREPHPADWSIVKSPELVRDLRSIAPLTPRTFEAMRIADRRALAPLLDGMTPNSDYFPTLDLGAERARFTQRAADGLITLNASRFDLPAALVRQRSEPSSALNAAVPDVPRVCALAIGARMRRGSAAGTISDGLERPTAGLLDGTRRFDALIATGWAPGDWRTWTTAAIQAEFALHGGTAGHADEAFYARVRAYLDRTGAPEQARASIDFMHGLAAWNWPEAARAGERLLPAAAAGDAWISPHLLLEGLVVARLAAGDASGARRAMDALLPASGRYAGTIPARLLAAHVRAAEGSLVATK